MNQGANEVLSCGEDGEPSIFYFLIKNNLQGALELLTNNQVFKEAISDFFSMSELETVEQFEQIKNIIDFNKINIGFSNIKEDVLLAFIKTFPECLKREDFIEITFDDDGKENLLEYAISTNKHGLMDYLIKNHSIDNPSIREKYINSVQKAKQVKNLGIVVENSKDNVYCIEARLENNEELPKIALTKVMLVNAISFKLSHLLKYVLNGNDAGLLNLKTM